MDEESIRQDRELARAAIRGLTSYAEQIARQGKDDEIQQVRSLVDALSLYWGVDGKQDWTGEFDTRVQRIRQGRSMPRHCSSLIRLKTVKGLGRYAEEMASAQGVEEIKRIMEIPDVIRHLGMAWEMSRNDIEYPCQRIGDLAESLQASQRAMQGMGM